MPVHLAVRQVGVLSPLFLPSTHSLILNPHSPAQHVTPITLQSKHNNKKNQFTEARELLAVAFWTTPTGRQDAAAGSDGCEGDISAGTKHIFDLRIGERRMMKTTRVCWGGLLCPL